MARQYASFVRKIEVEVETLEQVKEAVEAGADIIMLDNMSDEDMRKAVTLIAGRAKTECSGNVTWENIARLRDIGIDYVSRRPPWTPFGPHSGSLHEASAPPDRGGGLI